jgi:hypothetical protein
VTRKSAPLLALGATANLNENLFGMMVKHTEGRRLCLTRTGSWLCAFIKSVMKRLSDQWEADYLRDGLGLVEMAPATKAPTRRVKYEAYAHAYQKRQKAKRARHARKQQRDMLLEQGRSSSNAMAYKPGCLDLYKSGSSTNGNTTW